MALPDCICVSGLPLGEQLAAIYCAARAWTDDESLPTCICVAGLPIGEQLTAIYQAVFVAAEDESLTDPTCVRGHPLGEQLTQIYTALLALTDGADLPTAICVRGLPLFQQVDAIFCAALSVEIECTVPTVVSASIVGDQLTISFSENVTGTAGFTIFVDGDEIGMSYTAGEGTNTYLYTLLTPAEAGDDVILNYAPGDVAQRECLLADIEEFSVTNNTGTQFTYVQPDGFAYFQPDGVSLYLQP